MTSLYQRSVEIIRAKQARSGAFVASPNFPSYAFCWLRDGTFTAHAMDRAGEHDSARAFHRWADGVVRRHAWKVERALQQLERGQALQGDAYLHTRYTLEGEEVAGEWWEFQLDGYGTWLWGLSEHVRLNDDLALRDELWPSVQTVVSYLSAAWAVPNYDCWEEHSEWLHPYTLAALYAGLRSAAGIAPPGSPCRADRAEEIRAFVLQRCVADGYLQKSVAPTPDAPSPPRAVDASLVGVATPYGLLAADDALMQATLARIEADLHRPGGGVYRYQADTYYGGGEWVLLAAWLGWHYAETGQQALARELLQWVEQQADGQGQLPEQVSVHPLAPERYAQWRAHWGPVARPLLWSHAMHLLLCQALGQGKAGQRADACGRSVRAPRGASRPRARRLRAVVHEPHGMEHPYQQLPTERFPRDPLAAEPVRLGVATLPAGAAQAIWADWQLAGKEAGSRAEGEWLGDEADCSYWHVLLPAQAQGQRVTYHLHARQDRSELSSGPHTYEVAGWCSLGDVLEYRWTGDALLLRCAGQESSLQPWLTLRLDGPGRLDLRFSALPQQTVSADARSHPAEPGETCADATGQRASALRLAEVSDARLVVCGDGWQVVVQRHPCRLELHAADGTPLLVEAEPLAWLVGEGGRALRLRQTLVAWPGEAFYGLGERYNALDQRGQTLDVRVFDQYRRQGLRTYLPAPWLLSSRGFGLYLDTRRCVTYDLAATHPERWQWEAELGAKGELDARIVCSEPRQALAALSAWTGKPALPPDWAWGPWMSANEWNSQAVVMEQVRQTIAHDIPATVLVIEAWSDESTFYLWNDAQYAVKPPEQPFRYADLRFPANGLWPDPKGMIEELHRLGLRVVLWQIPVMKALAAPHAQHDADQAYMLEKGYCVLEANGQPYRVRPFWFHDGLLLDPTNDQAMRWWLSKRAYLLDELGVDGFKTDGGEHLWGSGTRFADGRRGDELWNLYPNLYAGAYHRFARERRGGDALTFSRAGYAGAQAFPCHWAGDQDSTWESFRAAIMAGLNAGLSGVPFWGWDLAGFSGEVPSAELYVRATAMAAFCPIMQYHSDSNEHRRPCRDRTPWNIAERTGEPRVVELYRQFAQLRMRLVPYIRSEAQHCADSGEPLMRPLFLDWPADAEAWKIADQYCFGRELLVAPVVEPGARERRLYLPAGEWQDFWDGTRLNGGQWLTRAAPWDIIPVYRRVDTGSGTTTQRPLQPPR